MLPSAKQRRKHAPFFHLCYADLCKLRNCTPHSGAKPHTGKNILDLNGDKVKLDEWAPILEALKYDRNLHVICFRSRHPSKRVLEEITTEAKAREVNRRPVLLTDFIMSLLMSSLTACIGRSPTVTCVEMDSVPLAPRYMSRLCQGISSNTSLQTITLHDCAIQDDGCEELCHVLRNVPNVKHLDVSGCRLGERSVRAIAEMIKYQSLQRFTESWKQSLRYRQPDVEGTPGLRRIVLNENPDVGDEGVGHLTEILKEDMWLKAIDMQACGITSVGALNILEMLNLNTTLDLVDVRENKAIDKVILCQIFTRLCINNANKPKHEYHWMIPKTSAHGTPSFQSLQSKQSVTSRPNMFRSTQNVTLNGLCKPLIERKGSSLPVVCSQKSRILTSSQTHLMQLEKTELKLKEVSKQMEQETTLRKKAESKHKELNIKMQELEKELRREKSLKMGGVCLLKVEAYESVVEVFKQFTAFMENVNEARAVRRCKSVVHHHQMDVRRSQSAHVKRVMECLMENMKCPAEKSIADSRAEKGKYKSWENMKCCVEKNTADCCAEKGKYKSLILEVDSSRSSQGSSRVALNGSSVASSQQSQEEMHVSDGVTNRPKIPSLSKVQQIFESLMKQSPPIQEVSQSDGSGDSTFYPLQALQPPSVTLNTPKRNWGFVKEDLEDVAEE